MQLHLERSHELVAKDLKILRVESRDEGRPAQWVAVTNDSRNCILIEFEIALEQAGQSGDERITSPAPQNSTDESAKWSASAMQKLYKSREGLNMAFG